MSPLDVDAVFGRKESSFQEYEGQVRQWLRMTHLERSKRAAVSILRMNSVARRVST